MFSYYGSKSKLAHLYPRPKFSKIIEPFSGSARYSLLYWEKDITIVDKFHKVISIWKYLQSASEKDILQLPDIEYQEKIPSSLSDPEKWLIGYCIARGGKRPCTKGHKFNNWKDDKVRIARDLYKIKHWKIILGDYKDLENEEVTWFIDPPYQLKGVTYSFGSNSIDYDSLGLWCRERIGQVIVCENLGATWLDFMELKSFTGAYKKNTEVYWTNNILDRPITFF